MVSKTTLVIGLILIAITATSIVIQLQGSDVKMRFDDDKATFYVLEDSRWRISGREFVSIWDGVTKLNRRSAGINRSLSYDLNTKITTVTKVTPYIRGPAILETWTFDGTISDVELFPISHEIIVINASGYIFQYEVRDLVYDGETIRDVTSPLFFGRKMVIEWQDGYYWSKVFKSGILKVRYRPASDYEIYNVRLFDPDRLFKDYYEEITWYNVTHTECIRNVTIGVNITGSTIECLEYRDTIEEKFSVKRIKDGKVRVGGRVISYQDRWCMYPGDLRVDCVQVNDGLHKEDKAAFKGCQEAGGMNCFILEFSSVNVYDISRVNSDVYIKGETVSERDTITIFEREIQLR